MALRTVGVRLTAETTGFTTKMKAAEGSVKSFHKEMSSKAASGSLDNIADRAGFMGAGLAVGFGIAIKGAMDFDKQMSAVAAGTNASAAEMEALRAAALKAGKDTQYSATQAAEGITELGKAGVSTSNILGGGLTGALDLAAAGQIDVGEAAETAASAMTQFKLSGKDIPHIADLLAAGAGKAQGSVHDMGAALNQAGLVASQTGLSIEETTGGLAAFASAGLTGSDAGTSFKQMLLMLQAPSDKTKGLMEDLGLSLYDSSGKFVGLAKFAGQLKDKLKDLTPEARSAAMAQIFGADATRAASVMYEQGAEGVQSWIDKVNDAGYAQETAAKLTDNLAGDVERLKGSLETMFIEGGSGATSGLRGLVKGLNALLDQFALMPSGVKSTITILIGLGAVVTLGGAAWVKMKSSIAATSLELEKVGPAGAKAATGLNRAVAVAGKGAAAFALLQVAGASIGAAFGESITTDTNAFADSLSQWATTGNEAGEAARVFGKDFNHMSYDLQSLGSGFWAKTGNGLAGFAESVSGMGGVMDESLQHAQERIGQVDATLAAMVQNGQAKEAAAIFNKFAEEGKAAGISVNDLKKGLPQYSSAAADAAMGTGKLKDATGGLGKSLDEATGKEKEYTSAVDAAKDAINGQLEAFTDLADKMKSETNPVFGLIDAQNKLTKSQTDGAQAQKDYEKAVKKFGKGSAEAKAAQEKVNQAVRDGTTASIDLEDKVGQLGTTFGGELSPQLRDTLKAAGLTDKQIKNLTGQFTDAKKAADKFSGKYAALASAPGATTSKDQLEKAWAAALGFDGDYKAKSSAPGAKSAAAEIQDAWNKANGFDGSYKANLSSPGAPSSKIAIADAWAQAKGFDGKYNAKLTISGDQVVNERLADLMIKQRALATGLSYPSAKAAVQKDLDRNRQRKAVGGHIRGPGTSTSDSIPALLSDNEYVIKAESVQKIGVDRLDHANKYGELPAFAAGGLVQMKFNTTAAKTKIPSLADVLAVVAPPTPPGGQTYKWIMSMVAQAFPGLKAISTYRPGARTLTGNQSLHAIGDAVDYPASHELAQFWNKRFKGITTELITPWNDLNLWKGKAHKYTGAVWNQHNFAGGNAHDHIGVRPGAGSAIGGVAATGALLGWIMRALSLTGTSGTWIGPLTTLIKRESGGNPNAINRWDSNARAGHPSQGLMQTIPGTFSAYRLKSLPNNILDPVANIVAGIRYIKSRYGSIFNVQQADASKPPKGYELGGLVREHIAMAKGGVIREPVMGYGPSGRTYSFGEYGPETVTPGVGSWQAGGNSSSSSINNQIHLSVTLAAGANPREAGRQIAEQLTHYLGGGGSITVRGRKVL